MKFEFFKEGVDVNCLLCSFSQASLDRIESSFQMELTFFLHNIFIELSLFCFDLTLGISEGIRVVAPVVLFLKSS
jgi:hypothetical protein